MNTQEQELDFFYSYVNYYKFKFAADAIREALQLICKFNLRGFDDEITTKERAGHNLAYLCRHSPKKHPCEAVYHFAKNKVAHLFPEINDFIKCSYHGTLTTFESEIKAIHGDYRDFNLIPETPEQTKLKNFVFHVDEWAMNPETTNAKIAEYYPILAEIFDAIGFDKEILQQHFEI